MKTKILSKNQMLVFLIGLMAGCGASGIEGINNPDPKQTYPLTQLKSTTQGLVYGAQLNGSDSNDVIYNGSITINNNASEMQNGVLVTPQVSTITLNDGTTQSIYTETAYFDSNANLIYRFNQTTGVNCSSVLPDSLPASVKEGDSGTLSTLICSNNSTQDRHWRAEVSANATIKIIITVLTKDELDSTIKDCDIAFTLDAQGNIIAYEKASTRAANNYSLIYSSM